MDYKFCPKCGGKLKITKEHEMPRLQCLKCKFIFYQDSKPTASAIILNKKNDMILLGRRKIEPSKGMWDIIGGFLEKDEHPKAGIIREVREETGLEIEILDMIGFFMDSYNNENDSISTLNICYVARKKSGQEKPDDDVSELKWFEISALPKELASKNGAEMLKEFKKLYGSKALSFQKK